MGWYFEANIIENELTTLRIFFPVHHQDEEHLWYMTLTKV